MTDKAVETTELIIDALDYAHRHNLDINNKEDVKEILEVLDPDHANETDVEEFMKLLQDTDTFLGITAKKKEPQEEKLPN